MVLYPAPDLKANPKFPTLMKFFLFSLLGAVVGIGLSVAIASGLGESYSAHMKTFNTTFTVIVLACVYIGIVLSGVTGIWNKSE